MTNLEQTPDNWPHVLYIHFACSTVYDTIAWGKENNIVYSFSFFIERCKTFACEKVENFAYIVVVLLWKTKFKAFM